MEITVDKVTKFACCYSTLAVHTDTTRMSNYLHESAIIIIIAIIILIDVVLLPHKPCAQRYDLCSGIFVKMNWFYGILAIL